MMKKFTVVMIIILVLLLAVPVVVLAAPEGKGEPDNIGKKPIDISGREYAAIISAGHNADDYRLIRGVDKDNPSSRIYFNASTGEEMLVASTVPLVAPDGTVIDPQWYRDGAAFVSGAGFFRAEVIGTEVKVWAGDERSFWDPLIYLDGVELQLYSSVDIGFLSNDRLLGDEYPRNTLSWSYRGPDGGVICTRYLRIIETSIQERWIFGEDPQGEIRIDHKQSGTLELWVGRAVDKNFHDIPCEVKYIDDEIVPRRAFLDAEYPVMVFATMTFYCDDYPYQITGQSREWGSGNEVNDTWATLLAGDGDTNFYDMEIVGVGWRAGTVVGNNFWRNNRVALVFDTSPLPDGATITSTSLLVYGSWKGDPYGDTPVINIYEALNYGISYWPSYYDEITNTAWDATPTTYANWNVGAWNGFGFNAAGMAGVNRTGYTHMGFREVTYDVGAAVPTHTDTLTIMTGFEFYGSGIGRGWCPRLVVVYGSDNPAITTLDASEVAMTTATLNSVVVSDGGEVCSVRFGYGLVSQTALNFNAYDTITSWVGGYYSDDHPSVGIESLAPNTPHYARVQIKNTAGTITSDVEVSFTTSVDTSLPSHIYFFERATEISFSWAKGEGADETHIRYSSATYPTTIGEGTQAYDGTSASFTHTGLSHGTTYYYSFWGQSGANTSDTYVSVMASTSMVGPAGEHEVEEPALPVGAFDDPDASNLPSIFQVPLYAAADVINQDRDTAAMVVGSILILVVGIGFAKGVGVGAAFLAMGVLMVALGWLAIVSLWTSVLFVIFGVGMGVLGLFGASRGGAEA